MCGIAGIYSFTRKETDPNTISKMLQALQHRGPDDEGTYTSSSITLGHKRLAIQDITKAGHQPMSTSDQRYTLVFNGEIYNHLEIKSHFNIECTSKSDTELLLKAFELLGPKVLDHINGMFAFAVWDDQKKELFIARDRIGIKPLYFHLDDTHFVFASELRAILASGFVPRRMNKSKLKEYLSYYSLHHPHSFIQGIEILDAGEYAIINEEGLVTIKYWTLDNVEHPEVELSEAKEGVRNRFLEAVDKRMLSDVPLGAFLSGGIDSTAIVGAMAKVSNKKVDTFSVAFEEKDFDESSRASATAKSLGTNHHNLIVKAADALDLIPEALKSFDHPSGDGFNTWLVSKKTKEAGITVALSGLGGDELFNGYENIFAMTTLPNKYSYLWHLPKFVRAKMADQLSARSKKLGSWKLKEILIGERSMESAYAISRKVIKTSTIEELLGPQDKSEIELIADISNGYISDLTKLELDYYLQDVLLLDTDMTSMAHSLEVRVPFLDHELVEYVYSLPDRVKLGPGKKPLLTSALADLIPSDVISHPKMGFTFPWSEWMKKELSAQVQADLESFASKGLIDEEVLMKNWAAFKEGSTKVSWMLFWSVFVLENWLKNNDIDH